MLIDLLVTILIVVLVSYLVNLLPFDRRAKLALRALVIVLGILYLLRYLTI